MCCINFTLESQSQCFADIDPITLNIDINSVKKYIKKNESTHVAVDISGRPAGIAGLKKIINKKKIKIISDSAQSPHAKYNNKKFAETIADVMIKFKLPQTHSHW